MSNFEFDTAYSSITGERVPNTYIPFAEADTNIDSEGCDVLLDGAPNNLADWDLIAGKTGQYGYRGAIMHPSESPDDDMIRVWVREAGGDVFALVVVESPCGYCEIGEPMIHNCEENEPTGWAIIYRDAA